MLSGPMAFQLLSTATDRLSRGLCDVTTSAFMARRHNSDVIVHYPVSASSLLLTARQLGVVHATKSLEPANGPLSGMLGYLLSRGLIDFAQISYRV